MATRPPLWCAQARADGSPCPVEDVEAIGQGIAVTIADSADLRLDAGFAKAQGLADTGILPPAIGMMDHTAAMDGPQIVDGVLQGIQHASGVGGEADAPAHDITGIDIDDEAHVCKPGTA